MFFQGKSLRSRCPGLSGILVDMWIKWGNCPPGFPRVHRLALGAGQRGELIWDEPEPSRVSEARNNLGYDGHDDVKGALESLLLQASRDTNIRRRG